MDVDSDSSEEESEAGYGVAGYRGVAMKMLLVFFVSCAASFAVQANEVYVCKGKNGEPVFTNGQCPDPKTTSRVGSYQPVPDDPRQARAAAAEAARINARNAAAVAASYPSYEAQSTYADAPFIPNSKNINGLSEHYRAKRDGLAEPGNDRTASGTYTNDLSNGYAHKGMRPPEQSLSYIDDSPSMASRPATPAPAPEITDCRVGAAGGVACYDTNGNASFGNVRNGAISGVDGNTQYLQRNGNGQLQTDNGTCVKDIYGKCQ